MGIALTDQIVAVLAEFSSASRLYELRIGDDDSSLLVEAFVAEDALLEVGTRDVIALSTNACVDIEALLGQPATLRVSLADGTREYFSGEICEAAMLGSDGGLARYRVRISSWLWRLNHVRNSRVWQDRSVIEIVDAVFDAYLPSARWRWTDDAGQCMSDAVRRSYCCQYRESDLAFVQRLLAEEGLAWRVEQTKDGAGLVLFADSSQRGAVPMDATCAASGGIRFHGARAMEESDAIQALSAQRHLHASLTTVLSVDYKARQVVSASSPSHYPGGSKLPELESCDVPGQYAYADSQQARRYADLQMQGQEARGQLWQGRSTVRTLRAGTQVEVIGAPLQQLAESAPFTVLRVTSIGVNNMPPAAQHALAELFGPIPELLEDVARVELSSELALAIGQARELGYANCFEALASSLVWRPCLAGGIGHMSPQPTAFGAQSAIVVGADGSDRPTGADELCCDRLGRIRIRFHWQDSGAATCWVRVAQRSAGGGMGHQFLPRIGQEVLVQFLEGDIDRPLVVGALYNGQGEGGLLPTPGGRRDSEADLSCFKNAHDRATSGQGNLAGGNSPAWHGASADSAGHRNAGAQWGIRSKEFGGGYGYSQLLFDDTDGQGRVQLRSTYAGSELNLGHLIHAADNYRGGGGGGGAERGRDVYGAERGGAGLMVSSYKIKHGSAARDSFGENAAGVALLKQALALAGAFSSAAKTHQTVGLAAYLGAAKANECVLDAKAAPLKAILTSLSGMSTTKDFSAALADASIKNTQPDKNKTASLTDPSIAISAIDGFAANAGKSVQFANGEASLFMSGGDTQLLIGAQMRFQTVQALGLLGGSTNSDNSRAGLQLISAKDDVNIQSQSKELKLIAKEGLNITSASAKVSLAAVKSITLTTVGGASITLSGHISLRCPGKISVLAGRKIFSNPADMKCEMPELPRGIMRFDETFQLLDSAGDPVGNMRYVLIKEDGGRMEGKTNRDGIIPLQQSFHSEIIKIIILGKI